MTPKTKLKTEEKIEVKPSIVVTSKTSKASSIIVFSLVTFIFAYIAYDYFVVKHRIENKIIIVNQKFDSLQTHINNKLPQIDAAIKIQSEQVKTLQNLSNANLKK